MIYRPVKSAYQTFYNYKSFQGHIDSILCFISLSINFFMISFKCRSATEVIINQYPPLFEQHR